MEKSELILKLKQFIEDEGRSCSMDICGITPEYVFKMWSGKVALEEIEEALKVAKER